MNIIHPSYITAARELMEAELEKQLRPPPVPEVTFRKSCRYRMWRFLEKPNSSCAARVCGCSLAFLVFRLQT